LAVAALEMRRFATEAPLAATLAKSLAKSLCAFLVAPAAAQTTASSAGKRSKKGPDNDAGDADKKKQDASEAQRAVEAALKLLEAGKAEAAVEQLTATLGAGSLPPAIMAKALYYRGMAYRQQQKPAQAIADLTSALWLKGGLSETDRADALRQRASAYQEAGLGQGGQPKVAALPAGAHAETAQGSSASTTTSASGGGFNLFANIFGDGTATTTSAPEPPANQGAHAPTAVASRGWASSTEVHEAPREAQSRELVTAAIPRKPEGHFRVQLALVRSEREAQAMAAKLKREHAAALAALEPEIDQTVLGNMGAFYRVRVGPFTNAQEGQALCARLKGSGLDCLVVTQ
jgi:cell division septation protein DedD